jgi:CRISPR-associated endonuclease/helicase Cas3
MNYTAFFHKATGREVPFEYQTRLAERDTWPDLLEAPTGAGKTAAIVLAWLWRRHFAPEHVCDHTPRRLVYCLPMRVLVEQTRDCVSTWLGNLELDGEVSVYVLMGGEQPSDWDLYPEREAILIGTQDMLLSRALNRGYALGRAHWPLPFGLLNNDSLWIFDEVQLMGSGLATTAQLAAFREKFTTWGKCPSLWVSATLRTEWLKTVDFRERVADLSSHGLTGQEWHTEPLSIRLNARKTLHKIGTGADEPHGLAGAVMTAHQAGTLTLVVVNTVRKAVALYRALKELTEAGTKHSKNATTEQPRFPTTKLLLLHSRYRPYEREAKLKELARIEESGGIVISTQVIEAGVDVSARTLFTELAPWASLVQRFGRCNRKGEYTNADAYWIDVDTSKQHSSAPYESEELDAARAELVKLEYVGPSALREHLAGLGDVREAQLYPYTPGRVMRRKDLLELFDTTVDLTGADLDVSPFIRETDDHDAQVFWREWDKDPNSPEPQALPGREELCAAPVNELRQLLKKKALLHRWDFLESRWRRADTITPGQVYLIPAAQGGYSEEYGWTADGSNVVVPVIAPPGLSDGNDRDPYSTQRKIWQTIAGHTNQVADELEIILSALDRQLTVTEIAALRYAARWHDWGKGYYVFQNALTAKAAPDFTLPPGHLWAKSSQKSERYTHPGFRHELASALGMLALGHSDLSIYLVAAHHGKVRLNIRSLPTETPPPNGQRFARGIWEGDTLPTVTLGGGVVAPEVTLSLAPMELGLTDGEPSWAERMLKLRDRYGPFRLAYVEAILCAADRRASANPLPGGDE